MSTCRVCKQYLGGAMMNCPNCGASVYIGLLDALVICSVALFAILIWAYYNEPEPTGGAEKKVASAAPVTVTPAAAPTPTVAPIVLAPPETPENVEAWITNFCGASYKNKPDREICKKREYRAKAKLDNMSIPRSIYQKCFDESTYPGYTDVLNCIKVELKKWNAQNTASIHYVCDSSYKNAQDNQACQVRERNALNTLETLWKSKEVPPAVSAKCNTSSSFTAGLKCTQDGMAAAGK